MRTVAIIVAAGRGERARLAGSGPKQYASIGGEAVLRRTLRPFLSHPGIDAVLVVIHPDDETLYEAAIRGLTGNLLPPAFGGATRQNSVLNGLERLAKAPPDRLLIHDGARPFVSSALIDRILSALTHAPGAVPALPVSDTMKRCAADGRIIETLDRAQLVRVQTPQGFHFAPLLAAHRKALEGGHLAFTDDAAVAEWAGLSVTTVAGEETNRKLTTQEDLVMADRELSVPPSAVLVDIRTGQGFDVHRFTAGDHVWLCGIKVPHSHGLEGHSDADVALHALTDALLGAIGDGDIGEHFPPSDPKWKGAASYLFLADAARRVRALAGVIANVDVTLLCEAPKIAPRREAMRARIAAILEIDIGRVAVKATTTEQLGFTGRREGIAAMAIANRPASRKITHRPINFNVSSTNSPRAYCHAARIHALPVV